MLVQESIAWVELELSSLGEVSRLVDLFSCSPVDEVARRCKATPIVDVVICGVVFRALLDTGNRFKNSITQGSFDDLALKIPDLIGRVEQTPRTYKVNSASGHAMEISQRFRVDLGFISISGYLLQCLAWVYIIPGQHRSPLIMCFDDLYDMGIVAMVERIDSLAKAGGIRYEGPSLNWLHNWEEMEISALNLSPLTPIQNHLLRKFGDATIPKPSLSLDLNHDPFDLIDPEGDCMPLDVMVEINMMTQEESRTHNRNELMQITDRLRPELSGMEPDVWKDFQEWTLGEHRLGAWRSGLGPEGPTTLGVMSVADRYDPDAENHVEVPKPLNPFRARFESDIYLPVMREYGYLVPFNVCEAPAGRYNILRMLYVDKNPVTDLSLVGPKTFRPTVDCRPSNRQNQRPLEYPPVPATALQHIFDKCVRPGVLDLDNYYFSIPVDDATGFLFCINFQEGPYRPTRVPQGATDAPAVGRSLLNSGLQRYATALRTDEALSTLIEEEQVPALLAKDIWELAHELRHLGLDASVIPDMDDLLILGKNDHEWFCGYKLVITFCLVFNLHLSFKSSVYAHQSVWSGRIVSKDGITFHPKAFRDLDTVKVPVTAGGLDTLLGGFSYMRQNIPDFAGLVQPLRAFVDKAAELAGSRDGKMLRKYTLAELGWTAVDDAHWETLLDAVKNRIRLAHLDPNKKRVLCFDASDTTWQCVVTMVTDLVMGEKFATLDHDPLAFLSGTFTGNQKKQAILLKEAHCIRMTILKVPHIIRGALVVVTDNQTLSVMVNPGSSTEPLSKCHSEMIQRIAMNLQAISQVTVYHLLGTLNRSDAFTRPEGMSMCDDHGGDGAKKLSLINYEDEDDAVMAPISYYYAEMQGIPFEVGLASLQNLDWDMYSVATPEDLIGCSTDDTSQLDPLEKGEHILLSAEEMATDLDMSVDDVNSILVEDIYGQDAIQVMTRSRVKKVCDKPSPELTGPTSLPTKQQDPPQVAPDPTPNISETASTRYTNRRAKKEPKRKPQFRAPTDKVLPDDPGDPETTGASTKQDMYHPLFDNVARPVQTPIETPPEEDCNPETAPSDGPSARFSDEWSVLPVHAEIRKAQSIALEADIVKADRAWHEGNPEINEERLWTVMVDNERRLWIPMHAPALKLRLLVLAHSSIDGHWDHTVTFDRLAAHVHWTRMKLEVRYFVKLCLLCRQNKGGVQSKRPWGFPLRGDKPGKVVYFDFFYMGESDIIDGVRYTYILIVKDSHSSFVQLYNSVAADSYYAAKALKRWREQFTDWETAVSDNGPHFANATIKALNRLLNSIHHFAVPYTPFSVGGIEPCGRWLHEVIRIMVAEYLDRWEQWPRYTGHVEQLINERPDPETGFSKKELFLNFKPSTKVGLVLDNRVGPKELPKVLGKSVTEFRNKDDLEALMKQIDEELQCKYAICNSVYKKRQEHRQMKHMREIGVTPAMFRLGDFALVAHIDHKLDRVSKLQCTWKGPYIISAVIDNWVYEVTDLRTFPAKGKKSEVHAIRLRPFAGNRLNVTEDLVQQIEYSISMFRVSQIHRVRFLNKRFEFLVQWRGLTQPDSTWTNALTIYARAPKEFKEFVDSLKPNEKSAVMDFVLHGKFPLQWNDRPVAADGTYKER